MPTDKYYMTRVSSGKLVDIGDLKEEDICLDDIERSLNHINRFTGHNNLRKPLTVAQHSLLCLKIAQDLYPDDPEIWEWVLIHDFAEAYTGDISTPVKKAIGKAFYDWVKPIEAVVERSILGYNLSSEDHMKVKVCDNLAYDIETRSMWNQRPGKNKIVTKAPFEYGRIKDRREMFDEVQAVKYVRLKAILNEVRDMNAENIKDVAV